MDSITHIVIGAAIGEIIAGKKIGKKAMIWGSIAHSLPDIDFIASFWMDTSSGLLAHRGITHSIIFCAFLIPLLSFIASKIHQTKSISFMKWICFFSTTIFLHIALDSFNNYGVGWFEPFNNKRFSFNAIFVVDPFFSIIPIFAFIILVVTNKTNIHRINVSLTGLGFAFFYLMYCLYNKSEIDQHTKSFLSKNNIHFNQYISTPAPLQSWLWFIAVSNDSGFHIAHRSVFDKLEEIQFQYFSKNDSLLYPFKNQQDLRNLIQFSQKFYTVEKWKDTIVFNDLRFGQILGWQENRGRFAFHYFLNQPTNNKLVVQRGRFAGWNMQVLKKFYQRIKGI